MDSLFPFNISVTSSSSHVVPSFETKNLNLTLPFVPLDASTPTLAINLEYVLEMLLI